MRDNRNWKDSLRDGFLIILTLAAVAMVIAYLRMSKLKHLLAHPLPITASK
jgi:hypothetical protein